MARFASIRLCAKKKVCARDSSFIFSYACFGMTHEWRAVCTLDGDLYRLTHLHLADECRSLLSAACHASAWHALGAFSEMASSKYIHA
jgi:hypothetical protein